MSPGAATPYPWKALESVTRESARRAANARRRFASALDLSLLGSALSSVCECEASLHVRRVTSEAPKRRSATTLGFELGESGVVCALSVEPELAAHLLARLLRRPIALSSNAPLDDSLSGALGALVSEAARRAGARSVLRWIGAEDASARARDLFVEAAAVIAGSSYQLLLALSVPETTSSLPVLLGTLGEIEVALPIVIGLGLAERSALADFTPGNAWFPGAGLWLDADGTGPIALAAAVHEAGVSAALSRDGKIVLRGGTIPLLADTGEPMSDSEKSEPSRLADAVLDSPVVVRIEMGAVSMSAREWAELGPGDVIAAGRRIADPVVLRVAGREVARGELVNLEGELGVRIRELVRS
jgi:flagellar motor switch/type III secretory pathway protein FliN